jgi:putative transport protein
VGGVDFITGGRVGIAHCEPQSPGVGLGIAGVLFAGILVGHCGIQIESEILEFVREFGLILFVFTIGLQLGPGFFASLRKQGLKLNVLAVAVVLLGVAMTLLFVNRVLGVNFVAALGLFSGATTNTPSLGATQQTLKTLGEPFADQATMPALAYAVAYPGGRVRHHFCAAVAAFFFASIRSGKPRRIAKNSVRALIRWSG